MISASGREYRKFSHRGACFTILTSGAAAEAGYNAAVKEIIRQREILSRYILEHREFLDSLVPVDIPSGAPEIVRRMHAASLLTGIGPMASVAGINAQLAAEAAAAAGAREAVVENGGDIFMLAENNILTALYSGGTPLASSLAFNIKPGETPVSVCSSSSRMGHSVSFGDCDLAAAVSADGALADSAATLACNLVKSPDDVQPVLDRIIGIKGIRGLFIIKGDKIGMAGMLPELVGNMDSETESKITKFGIV